MFSHHTRTKSSIELWAETVAVETATSQVHDILAPTSSNPRLRKRKPTLEPLRINPERSCKKAKTMADPVVGDETGGERRRPGRPRGRGQGRGLNTVTDLSSKAEIPEVLAPGPVSSSLPSRPGSPKKQRGKTVNQARADASIDMKFLESCQPRVELRSLRDARQTGALPQYVADLYTLLHDTPSGFIPARLRNSYEKDTDTPRKSRDAPLSKDYSANDSWIPLADLRGLKSTVDQVVKMAARNYRTNAHERQWGGTTVAPLINEVLKWPQNAEIVSLNIENCSIEPLDIRMVRPNGFFLDDESRSGASKVATEEEDVTTSRMVDVALGLDLDNTAARTVTNAFRGMKDNEHSLNQSLAYIRDTPLFLDIELKKSLSNRNPDVQLAIWMAALHKKRLHHKWDTSMPMPGIVVSGHDWQYYLTFESMDGLIMMGPQSFGSTLTTNGTYEIAYKLNILAQWGSNQYKQWFEKEILGWCRKTSREAGLGG